MSSVPIHNDHKELDDKEFLQLKEQCLEVSVRFHLIIYILPFLLTFSVGCTLISSSGKFYSGANVENASSGACICAERNTLSMAILDKQREFKAIAISSDSKEPITPCGICRQSIREFAPNVPIFMFGGNGERYMKVYLHDLLPLSFGPENLGK